MPATTQPGIARFIQSFAFGFHPTAAAKSALVARSIVSEYWAGYPGLSQMAVFTRE